jgi:hypothetical protein
MTHLARLLARLTRHAHLARHARLARLLALPFLVLAAVALSARPVALMNRIPLVPAPKKVAFANDMTPFPAAISITGLDANDPDDAGAIETLVNLFATIPAVKTEFTAVSAKPAHAYKIVFEKSAAIKNPEGYRLVSDAAGITIRHSAKPGRYYGAQTLCQLLAYAYHGHEFLLFAEEPAEPDAATKHFVPLLTIDDAPAYKTRSFMVDMGRATYSMDLLKRVIRIMGQLKLNTLHMHILDDQMCGLRFKNLPLGGENPHAITTAQLKEIVRYARRHNISIMPEIESWGHVQSIVYHYPELCGGSGVYNGASFAIGEKTYALLEKIYDEVIGCLEDNAALHVGLDEAAWTVAPGEENNGHTPANMVGRIYEILMRVAARQNKNITMHLWADHGGRPLPDAIKDKVVIEPWRYQEANKDDIIARLAHYGGAGKTPLMMGAGASSQAYNGAYEATRIWCAEGVKYPNVLGVTLCMWESNDIAGRITTLYCGADFAWKPASRSPGDKTGERYRYAKDHEVRKWQRIFPDANPDAINKDRGPEVQSGRYCWPPLAGKPVTPVMDWVVPKAKASARDYSEGI